MAWNKPTSNTVNATSSSRSTGHDKMPRLRRGLLAGVIVVLGAGLAAWLLMRGEADSRPPQKKERGRIKEVKPAVTNAIAAVTNIAQVIDPKKMPDPHYLHPMNPNLPKKKYIPTIEEVEKSRLGPDGKPRPRSIYKTPLEQSLAMIFSTEIGAPPPMLPDIPRINSEDQLVKLFRHCSKVSGNEVLI